MTTQNNVTATAESDSLLAELNNLKKAPVLKRGEAALRFGATTIAVIRRLEHRILKLEGMNNG